jgi:hypothetical protein
MDAKKPMAQFRAGLVSSAVWKNQIDSGGQSRTILKASLVRRYMDESGAWQSTHSFSRNDIPLAIHVLQKAFETMLQTPAEEAPADVPAEQEPE